MTFLRRFLVLIAFAFWQGGFTFYSGVVVHIGLGVNRPFQAAVTKAATNYLNIAGAVALVLLAWDLLPADPLNWRRSTRALLGGLMLLMLGAQVWLHVELDREFTWPAHQLYLWASTLQWACALVYLALTLTAWRAQDQTTP